MQSWAPLDVPNLELAGWLQRRWHHMVGAVACSDAAAAVVATKVTSTKVDFNITVGRLRCRLSGSKKRASSAQGNTE